MNFTATLIGTVLLLEWAPPEEDDRNGDIISYSLSCSINDNEIFELNLTDINEIYLGVYRHEATYSCDIYASTSAGGGPTASASVTTGGKLYSISVASRKEIAFTNFCLCFQPLAPLHTCHSFLWEFYTRNQMRSTFQLQTTLFRHR